MHSGLEHAPRSRGLLMLLVKASHRLEMGTLLRHSIVTASQSCKCRVLAPTDPPEKDASLRLLS